MPEKLLPDYRHASYTERIPARMDIIFIDDFRISTFIGVYPRERAAPQTVEISLQIGVSTRNAGLSDDLRDTIDYAAVVERLRAELSQRHFGLLEALAEHIAEFLRKDFSARWVRVSVAKPSVIRNVRRAGIIIERGDMQDATHAQ